MTSYVLNSIPLFSFMAALLERSGIAKEMYSSLNIWLNRTGGGIAIVTSIMAVIMAAMSGNIGGEAVLLGLIVAILPGETSFGLVWDSLMRTLKTTGTMIWATIGATALAGTYTIGVWALLHGQFHPWH